MLLHELEVHQLIKQPITTRMEEALIEKIKLLQEEINELINDNEIALEVNDRLEARVEELEAKLNADA